MKLSLLLAVSLLTVPHVLAADITGSWAVDGNLNGTPISFDCAFQQMEKKLTGTCKAYQFDVTATGTIDEDNIQFSYTYNFAGEPYKCTYTGKLTSATEVKGAITVAGIEGSKGEFVAKKT